MMESACIMEPRRSTAESCLHVRELLYGYARKKAYLAQIPPGACGT